MPQSDTADASSAARYDAFISYSHAKDKPVAAALQNVVQKLGKPWYRRRSLRAFRDDTSLAATPELWPTLEKTLDQSRFIIILASSQFARSKWCGMEVAHWLAHKSLDTLLIAVTEGDLSWDEAANDFVWDETTPLPAVLKGRFRNEPKWIDLRPWRDAPDASDPKFIDAGADLAAAVHGRPKEDLLSQEVRQQKRALRLAWSAAASLTLLAGGAGWQWWEAETAKRAAIAAEKVATEQRNAAEKAERQAVAERDRAEKNLALARKTADDLVFRIARDLRNVEGLRVESVRQILETAQAVMDDLARSAPDDPQLRRSRAAMLHEFANTYLTTRDFQRALAAAKESVAIVRGLLVTDAGNVGRQRDLSVALYSVGDVLFAGGDHAGALSAYEESLAVARGVVKAEPDNSQWQDDLGMSLVKVGNGRRLAGDHAGALAAYEESADIARRLVAREPNNGHRLRQLGAVLSQAADVRVQSGDHAGALAGHQESLATMRKLADGDPRNAGWLRDLTISLDRVGDRHLSAGNRVDALSLYNEALAIRRKLAATDPANALWQTDLAISLYKVSSAVDRQQVGAPLREALAILEGLERAGKLGAAQLRLPGHIREVLASLTGEAAAVGD